jgi:hypothetical protein
MEDAQPLSISKPAAPRFSPLNQHPLFPKRLSDTTQTQTIFLEHPFERLSPTLAASPRVVEAPLTRRASVHPDVSETMQKGLIRHADFFEDGSSESEWEDKMNRIMQSPTASSGPGLRDRPYDVNSDHGSETRGRNRQRSTITSLPRLTSPLTNNSGVDTDYSGDSYIDDRGTSHARKMSLTRMNKDNVRLVDNRSVRSSIDSPRLSLRSAMSLPTSPLVSPGNPAPFSASGPLEDTLTALPQSPTFRSHHRRTASSNSTSDSVLADSIINAHVMTMRALEALSSDPRGSGDGANTPGRTYLHSSSTSSWPKSTSFSANRRVNLSPLSTGADKEERVNNHRSARIYSPAVKTPNPFAATITSDAANSDLPIPKASYIPPKHSSILDSHLYALNFSLSKRNTEDYTRLDSARTDAFPFSEEPKSLYDDRKGKCVLGLMTGKEEGFDVDMRSRRERNESAQGLVRSSDRQNAQGGGGGGGAEVGVREVVKGGVVIWVGVRRWTWEVGRCACACGSLEMDEEKGTGTDDSTKGHKELVPILIPTTIVPESLRYSLNNIKDEKTRHLRHDIPKQHNNIAFDDKAFALGLRAVNRRLTGNWIRRAFSARTLSGIRLEHRSKINSDNDIVSSTWRKETAESLLTIHPAHRSHPSKSDAPKLRPQPSERELLALYNKPKSGRKRYTWVTWARSTASAHDHSHLSHPRPILSASHPPIIRLTYTLSCPRILLVMSISLMLSVAAALAWIFLGCADKVVQGGRGDPSERAGSGMAIAAFVLLVEAWGFGAWVAFS